MDSSQRFEIYARAAGRLIGGAVAALIVLGLLTGFAVAIAGLVWSWL